MLEPRPAKDGVELYQKLDIDFRMRGDEQRLKQIVLNLLSNAVKFTPSGGRVDIEAGVDAEGNIMLRVRDTGVGIAEDDLERIMQVFGQVESGLRRKEGTGLGLPLTKRLVEAMGGHFLLSSQIGVGTVATVVLPGERIEASGELAASVDRSAA